MRRRVQANQMAGCARCGVCVTGRLPHPVLAATSFALRRMMSSLGRMSAGPKPFIHAVALKGT